MCLIKSPKVTPVSQTADTAKAVLRNPYLDGIDPIIRSRATGVRSLRIDRGASPAATPTALPTNGTAATAAADPSAEQRRILNKLYPGGIFA